ncbi:phosphatidylglycerol lysyltransferase domain-containing protein [Actinomadura rugatobispora]|uniref:Phosphatidylglycerol lysyltransferase domain-containing protein n=1 Tax=Actinomadura rugatobispora TaxID=1994 RepID=A0ABW1A0P1_9ACTN
MTQARMLGTAVAGAGVVAILSGLSPQWRGHLRVVEGLLAPEVMDWAAGSIALIGLGLILLGRGVSGRRRLAWRTTLILLAVATLVHVLDGLDVPGASITLALAAVLVWRRRLFVVGLGPARWGSVARLGIVVVTLDFLYGIAGLALRSAEVRPGLTVGGAVQEVAARLVGMAGPLTITGRFGQWFPASVTVVGGLTLAVLLAAAFAPIALRGVGPATERAELAGLLGRTDGGSLDPFILRTDKSWVFSGDRRAALGMRYVHGVALATGDPVGAPAAFPAAVREFLGLCGRTGWRPAVIGLRQDLLPIYLDAGLRSIYIGDEAMIDVSRFDLTGRAMRNVRQAVSRTRNFGITTQILREGEVPADLRRRVLDIAAAQRGAYREFGFSMALGDLLTGAFPGCVLIVCRDATSRPVAFQRYVPCRRGTMLSLDAMRRLPAAPNGVNERMIIDMVGWAGAHGVTQISLNFAAFRTLLDEATQRGPGQAMAAWALRRGEGRFGMQVDSLRRFNAKFHPQWNSRYLVYRSRADLPAIGLAALSAEGFLPFDPGRRPPDGSRS